MIYLHEKRLDERFVRHLANEVENDEDEVATYKIKQKETDIIYDDAIDVVPCRYTYETTEEKISVETEENVEQIEN